MDLPETMPPSSNERLAGWIGVLIALAAGAVWIHRHNRAVLSMRAASESWTRPTAEPPHTGWRDPDMGVREPPHRGNSGCGRFGHNPPHRCSTACGIS
jgi:hypothetical protein